MINSRWPKRQKELSSS